jgi:RNA polymerase sigma-70 factor (ECF subfamily)
MRNVLRAPTTGVGRTAMEVEKGVPPSDLAAASDEELVLAAKEAPSVFAEIYRRHLAEDATSQTFLNALNAIDGYRGGNAIAWLVAIARNATRDVLRSEARLTFLDPTYDSPDMAPGPEETAGKAAELRHLWQAIDALPESQRLAITLQLADWSLAASAEAMGKSVAAVKMLRSRAVDALRLSLATPALAPRQPTPQKETIDG